MTHHLKAYGWTYTGDGVDIYIIDSGVRATHDEFTSWSGSRVTTGRNFSGDSKASTDTEPCISHGTSVASLAAGNTVGVARGATVVPVRVSPCDASQPWTWGNINLWGAIQAVDWVIEQRQLYSRPSVINMSFYKLDPDDDIYECAPNPEGNPTSCLDSFESQIQGAIANGITIVASANNQDRDNCNVQTPARLGYGNETLYPASGRTITVGGTDIENEDYYCANCLDQDRGSNRGPCVSFYAPADRIKSASIESNNAYRDRTDQTVSSGTSFASPIVAGAAARWLDQYPWLTPAQVWYWLQQTATSLGPADFDGDGISENNRLLYIDVYH